MKTNRSLGSVRVGLLLLTAALAGATPARAQSEAIWSSVGSGGTVDEQTLSAVSLNEATAGIKATTPALSFAYLRYAVSMRHRNHFYILHTPEPPFETWLQEAVTPYPKLKFSLTFSKNEDGALVTAQLRRVRLSDGSVTAVATIDTLSSLSGPATQTVEKSVSCSGSCFEPGEYAYFVQASLLKQTTTADPRLVAVRVTLGF